MARDRMAVDPLADPHERAHQDRIDLARRGLRTLTTSRLVERFFEEVEHEQESGHLSFSEAMAAVATREPELWCAARDAESLLLSGTKAQLGGLGTAPETDQFGRVHLRDLTAENIREGVLSLSNGMLKGTGPKNKGNGPITEEIDPRRTGNVRDLLDPDRIDQSPDEDDVDPYASADDEVARLMEKEIKRTGATDSKAVSAALKSVAIRNPRLMKRWGAAKRTAAGVKDLDSQGATRTAAKERGFTPIDEKLVQNFLDSDQIDQDAIEGDPDAQRTMAVRAWLYKKGLTPTAANIKAALKATAE
jgi:hypothetical protein